MENFTEPTVEIISVDEQLLCIMNIPEGNSGQTTIPEDSD